jgi:hypothetical protein
MVNGVPPQDLVKLVPDKWKELDEFQRDNKIKNSLEVQAKMGKDVTVKLKAINVKISANSFAKLSSDGQFTPIAEDIDMSDDGDGFVARKGMKLFERGGKIGQGFKSLFEFLYIRKNTKVFGAMLKLNYYGDPVFRQIIIDQRLKDKITRAGRKVPKGRENDTNWLINQLNEKVVQQVYDDADQMFVNYGYVDNRYIKYADNIMGEFFSKYYLRQGKAVTDLAVKKPLAFAGFHLGQHYTGIDFADPLDTYDSGVFSAIANRWMLDDVGNLLVPHVGELMPSPDAIVTF